MAVATWGDHRLLKSSNSGLRLRKALSGGTDKFWTVAASDRAMTGFVRDLSVHHGFSDGRLTTPLLPITALYRMDRHRPQSGPSAVPAVMPAHAPNPTWTAGRDFAIENGRNAGG
jgi:hypothetical protein